MRTYKLHLIRHGTTDANLQGIYCGSTDLSLNDVGIAELGEILDAADYPYVEWVFSSPLRRAVETAEILYPGMEITEIENLRETSFGEYEGKSMDQLKDDPDYARWVVGDPSFLPVGAEPPEAFFNRSVNAVISIIDMMMSAGVYSAAIVTHAGVIGNILSGIAYPKAPSYEWNTAPGCGYTVLADPTLFLREPVLEVTARVPDFIDKDSDEPEDNDPWDDVDWEDDSLDDELF